MNIVNPLNPAVLAARKAYYDKRADWHARMAAYCITVALKRSTDEIGFEGFLDDACTHARDAMHFALAGEQVDIYARLEAMLINNEPISLRYLPGRMEIVTPDVGSDIPGGGAP